MLYFVKSAHASFRSISSYLPFKYVAAVLPQNPSLSIAADRQGGVILPFFDGADDDVVAVILIDLHGHAVADFMAEHGLANRGFLADEALEGILPERRDQLDGLLLIVLLDVDRHLVKQADLVRVRADVDDLRRFDHALEIADAAVVAVFLAFGRFIFEILAQIAEFPRGFYVLDHPYKNKQGSPDSHIPL